MVVAVEHDLRYRAVHPPSEFLLISSSSFRRRLPSVMLRTSNRPKLFSAQTCRKPRKVNDSGFPSPRSSGLCRVTPEPDRPSLVFAQFRSVLAQSLFFRFVFVLEPKDGVIRVADDDELPQILLRF